LTAGNACDTGRCCRPPNPCFGAFNGQSKTAILRPFQRTKSAPEGEYKEQHPHNANPLHGDCSSGEAMSLSREQHVTLDLHQ
jgi:hypothetical protein